MRQGLGTRLLAELIGTFALIFVGVGAIAMTGGRDLLAIALAHGVTIAIMATALGPISGGHFNPAVSFALWSVRKLELNVMLSYWGAQLLGATLASLLWLALSPDLVRAVGFGIPAVGQLSVGTANYGVNSLGATLLELVMTFFLVLTITTVAVRQNHALAGLFIGLTITIDILLGGPLTGAAMNPARWFGPALVGLNFSNFWVWLVGPLAGAAAAIYTGMWLYDRHEQTT